MNTIIHKFLVSVLLYSFLIISILACHPNRMIASIEDDNQDEVLEFDSTIITLYNETNNFLILSDSIRSDSVTSDSLKICALECLDSIQNINNQIPSIYIDQFNILLELKEYNKCLSVLNNLENISPDPILFFNQGIIYDKLGRIDSANIKYNESLNAFETYTYNINDEMGDMISRAIVLVLVKGKRIALRKSRWNLIFSLFDFESSLRYSTIKYFDKQKWLSNY